MSGKSGILGAPDAAVDFSLRLRGKPMRELETPSAEIAAGEDIATIVAAHAKDGAGRLAVIEGYRRVDWREHGARIHQLANALSDIGKVLKRELRAPYWCGRDD